VPGTHGPDRGRALCAVTQPPLALQLSCCTAVPQMYGKTLAHDLQGDLSGRGQKFFCALISVRRAWGAQPVGGWSLGFLGLVRRAWGARPVGGWSPRGEGRRW
jgi:hypothetical protein